ncbi:DUF4329 domain-containing protein [Pseudomonas cedrina]|uniref:DUF4329 domain-containing protein n=1 Tax=Pseudomonas cedrina TaxID=651740 RepID=UPI00278701CA|nr:DUF4329 domain-containing protein [Pseudomonas cedrina]MDQ0650961.1 hypothetical protein [Pseudomonas cedrina]
MEEPSNRDRRAVLRGHAKLGKLTPAFASADEVALYVHGRVGLNLQVEYGSVILRRLSDGRYVGSEPRPDRPTVFGWDMLLDHDPVTDAYQSPEGFEIVASWHVHPNTTENVTRLNPKWSAHQVTAFQDFYSVPDVIFNHQHRQEFKFAYLSGPLGTLLKFQFEESPAAINYVRWLQTSGSFDSPHAHDGTLEGVYRKLASVGQLTFLASSPYWGGSLGLVPADWVPYQPWPLSTHVDGALSLAWSRIQRKPTVRQRVLILQSDTLDHYVATEPEQVKGLTDVLPTLPVGYHLYGIYVHSRPLPGNYPEWEPWLYKNFISPLDLAQHIWQFRQYSLGPQSTLGVSLYIRMRDEAMLRYRFSGSALESQLLIEHEDGTVRDNGIQAALHNGSLLTRGFVGLVAKAGELSVEKTSALWDRPGIVDEHWLPYSKTTLPSLSAAFLTADDAARYAHQQIGPLREQEMGGLILKRRDGYFVITAPVSTGPRPFAFAELYPMDRQKKPIILTAGHRLHGRYGSRQALSLSDPAQAARYKWTRADVELYGQTFHDLDVADLLTAECAGYLSGAEDSLIALAPSTNTDEWRQLWQADATNADSAIARSLAEGTRTTADMVRTLAECGTLRIVIGNALWGPAGFVELDWAPGVRVLEFQRPESVSHGPVLYSADAAADDVQRCELHNHGEHYADVYFGFILKHESREEYVASQLIPVNRKAALLSLASLYGEHLPDGFGCHALYYARPLAGNGAAHWLQRFFIELKDLGDAITQARANASRPSAGAPIYIAPPDGALLCYQSPSTSALFETLSDGDAATVLQAKLDRGTTDAVKVVRQVATSGSLRVIRTSHCWARSGPVEALWNPYANLLRRRLSPTFLTMDDAARYVRRRVALNLDTAYGGLILRRDDGWFVATEPARLLDEVFDVKWIFPDELVARGLYPPRTVVVASYHSRPARHWPFVLSPAESAVYSNMFSTRLLSQALLGDPVRRYHYLLAPEGAVIRLRSRPELKYLQITEADLIARPHNPHSWLRGTLEQRIRSGQLTPGEYVNRVARTFELQVVQSSALWGEAGPVSAWRAFAAPARGTGNYVQARQDPVCSPVHGSADDAARYAHEMAGARSELQFGYVLQAMGKEQFVATLPVTDDGSGLAHRRVFSDAGYPHRYELGGMYICGAYTEDFHPGGRFISGDEIYRGLISPVTLQAATYQVSATAKRAALPLYLSCADGALLKFTVRNGILFRQNDQVLLKLRSLTPRAYIRRIAAAGDLRILVPSDNWPGGGVVDAQWQPGRSRGVPPANENHWAQGPIHAHRDDAAEYIHRRAGRFEGQQAISALLEKVGSSDNYIPTLAEADEGFPSATAARLFPAALVGVHPQWPQGYRVSAAHLIFHAGLDQPQLGAERSYQVNFVSWRELGFYLHILKQQGLHISGFYLTARDGALLSYTPSFSRDEYNLLATTGKWLESSGYTAFAPAPSRVISELARIGELRVIRSGEFWTAHTRLAPDLKMPDASTQRPVRDEL